jgi:hypothetical protein
MMNSTLHVMRTNTKMSLEDPFANEYAESGLVAYVVQHTISGNLRLVTSWGHLGSECEVGKIVTLVGDQSGRRIGEHRVVAIMDLTTRVTYTIKTPPPSPRIFSKLKHYVVK